MGVFDLSIIALFAKHSRLRPLKLEDLLRVEDGSRRSTDYLKERSYLENRFLMDMTTWLQPEIQLYDAALSILCMQLASTGLWNSTTVQDEAKASPKLFSTCEAVK